MLFTISRKLKRFVFNYLAIILDILIINFSGVDLVVIYISEGK